MKVRVWCYAGYRADEVPLRFRINEWMVEVERIIDRAQMPDGRYFGVLGDDGRIYRLTQNDETGDWILSGPSRGG